MQLNISLDHDDFAFPERHKNVRALAGMLLHAIGDLDETDSEAGAHAGETPKGSVIVPPPPPPSARPAATAPASVTSAAPAAVVVPLPPTIPAAGPAFSPPPPPPVPVGTNDDEGDAGPSSNVVNFPTPPPPPSGASPAATNFATGTPVAAPAAGNGSPVSGAAPAGPAEFDSSGLPWDARIHQKSKNKKKDGTWKLIKGLDATIAAAVVTELAARKGAASSVAPPVTPPGSVPLPPVSNVPAPPPVPAPTAPPSVPVPPPPAVGSAGAPPPPPSSITGMTFRQLLDKITEATKASKITPSEVSLICQECGAANLMQLNSMPQLIENVNTLLDAKLLGL